MSLLRCIKITSNIIRYFLVMVVLLGLVACSKSTYKVNQLNRQSGQESLLSTSIGSDTSPLLDKSVVELLTAGFTYLRSKNYQLAELHFRVALEKEPDTAEAYIGIGQIEQRKGNYPLSSAFFEKAAALNPNSLAALLGSARALRLQGKLNTAIEKINAAMMISPNEIEIIRELALIYDLMGNEELSLPLYQELVNRAPDQAENHNNLGLNHIVGGRYDEAILSFLQAVELDNDNNKIKNNLASAYALNGMENKALKIFASTVGESAAYNNLGYLYMNLQRWDDAERALKKALLLSPKHYLRAQENLDTLIDLRMNAVTEHRQ